MVGSLRYAWWIEEQTEWCIFCWQGHARELGWTCVLCERSICPMCVQFDADKQTLCPECDEEERSRP